MKFYLTKAAQLAAEGKSPANGKAPAAQSEKQPRARRSTAVVPSGGPVLMDAPSSASTATPSAPISPTAPAAGMVSASAEAPVAAGPKKRDGKRKPSDSSTVSPARQPKPAKGVIAIGGLPRVDLLPPEVRAERHAAVNVRRAWTAVAGLVIIVGVAGGTAAVYATASKSTLAASQKETSSLTAQSAGFAEVNKVQNQIDLIDAARKVGGSTDIDWPSYLAKVQATLPRGMELATVTIDSASPVVAYAQATTPLEGQRVATLTFSSTSTSLPDVPTWLTSLQKLPGYTDASAGTVALSSGVYTSNVVVHIDTDAFSHVYSKKGK